MSFMRGEHGERILSGGLTRAGWPLGRSLRLGVPVVQAPLGNCDGPRLASAVSRAGGLGCLTVHATPLVPLRYRLRRIHDLTTRPVLIALTAQWDRDAVLETCLEEGFRHFQVFWWNGPRQTPRIHAGGGVVFWQVGNGEQTREAMETGADILIAQGTDAGGQVRSPLPLQELISEIRTVAGDDIPIVAGGGLADGRDVANVLSWGASAALLGTRFLLSEEAAAPRRHKNRLVHAAAEDLTLDVRLVGDWPCAPRRRLVTPDREDAPSLFAGRGLSRIRKVLSVGEIVRQIDACLPAR